MDTIKTPKNANFFSCIFCDFECCKLSDYNRHVKTAKHIKRVKGYNIDTNDTKKTPKNAELNYKCDNCDNLYKYHSGLWRHKNICKQTKEINYLENKNTIIMTLLEQNKELQNKIIDMCKNNVYNSNNIINTNNNNSHNKTFNLHVFLNETCKDAMNISEFVESLQIQIADLENVGKVGYVDGIANIIVKNLKALDVSKRPVHCSDLKREVMYVKDENKWEKDNEDKDKLRKAIKHVAHKNMKMIPVWKELNPKYVLDEGKANDEYIQIVMKSMGGSDKAQDISYENKIISKLAKSVVIDKENGLITL